MLEVVATALVSHQPEVQHPQTGRRSAVPPCGRRVAEFQLPSSLRDALLELRFALQSGHRQPDRPCPLCAITGLMRRSNLTDHSMTSSARASSVGGTARPSDFAVLRLITNSNLVGCCTGRSAGFSP